MKLTNPTLMNILLSIFMFNSLILFCQLFDFPLYFLTSNINIHIYINLSTSFNSLYLTFYLFQLTIPLFFALNLVISLVGIISTLLTSSLFLLSFVIYTPLPHLLCNSLFLPQNFTYTFPFMFSFVTLSSCGLHVVNFND